MRPGFSFADLWRRLMLRRTSFSGSYRKLSLLYAMQDPWEMDSDREQFRFAETERLLSEIAPRYGSILELGAGEGHQSLRLATLTDDLQGLELSAQAVARARARCPAAQFVQGRLEDIPKFYGDRVFDLVTACEVLYYVEDFEAAIRLIQSRTGRLFASSYSGRADRMRAAFSGPGWRRLSDISKDGTVWECYLWERAAA